MSSVEWYYAKGKRRLGPVTSVELKQLADQTFLSRDDLIWREGMPDWLPAVNVRGLFDPSEVEPPVRSDPPPSEDSSDLPEVKVEPADTPEPPSGAPPLGDMAVAPPPNPAVELGPSVEPPKERPAAFSRLASAAFEQAGQPYVVSPFDLLLNAARRKFNGHFARSTATIFAIGGHWGLYAAMIVMPIAAVVLGLAANSLALCLVPAAVGVAVLALLQYMAARFLVAIEGLDQSTSGRMTSTVVIDVFALAMMFLGVAGLIVLALLTMATGQILLLAPAVGTFIFCQYMAVVGLNHEALNFTVDPKATPGEEALSVLSFLLKIGLRMTPVVFGTGVILGALILGFAAIQTAVWPEQLDQVLLQTLPVSLLALSASAMAPALGYVVFITCHLAVDLARGVLSLNRNTS